LISSSQQQDASALAMKINDRTAESLISTILPAAEDKPEYYLWNK
jgi:hypothetical protein